ncbi:hypothetical protein [Herbaspirillum frisingense]|uniref:hypothetical protein n=1 Tax=Herbaspirillum frisingense TaxID=92645 RepID=UPI0039B01C84
MNSHRQALEQIMRQCAQSRTYTRRVQVINEIAMKALGITAGQRHEEHLSIMTRIGDEPAKQAYLARRARAAEKAASAGIANTEGDEA